MDLSTPLKYGDITQVNFSTIKNVLFVNTAAQSLIQYVKTDDDTFAILYDNTSTTDEVMQCFRTWFPNAAESSLNRIGFAFHYGGADSIPFMNQEPIFTDSDLGDSAVVFSPNMQFMLDLLLEFRTVTHLDFLACGTLLNDKCKQYYNLLQVKTGVVIGASSDNTGNIQYGGDWIMESTHEDIEFVYFTAEITNWASLLVATTGTITDFISNNYSINYVWSSVTGNAVCSSSTFSAGFSGFYTILSYVTVNTTTYPVTDISGRAFNNKASLTSITIPPSVVNIGISSFESSGITTVTFSDISLSKLANIYYTAFSSTALTYIWLPYNVSFIAANAFEFVDLTLVVLPSANQQITIHSSSFKSTLTATFYVYTSSDLGATFNYNKFIGSPAVTSDTILNNAYSGFSSNKLTATIWQPIKSMAILSGTRYVNGSYYVYKNASFDVSFTKIIPGTTYTSTGSLSPSSLSTNSALLTETTKKTFTSSSSTAGPIILSMSDNSPPLTIKNVTQITQSNIQDAVNSWCGNESDANIQYGTIGDWDVSQVTDMSNLFAQKTLFNSNISGWNVSQVRNMSGMFNSAVAFNADISKWTVSRVINMSGMFNTALAFNADISGWNVSQVSNMSYMFNTALEFNADISKWTVSQVNDMSNMFNNAPAFNANISAWNVGNVTNMIGMFYYAVAFNQNLSKWNVQNIPSLPLDFLVAQTIPLLTGRLPLWGTNGSYLNNFHHTFYTMQATNPTILTRTIYDNAGNLMEIQDISFGGMAIADVLSLLDGGAGTNPYTIGTIDASANRISMDLAYCNVYTQALTSATQKRLLMTDVNTKYKEPHTAATTTYIVTVSGDALFWLAANGRNLGANRSLLLTYGNMYVFDQSDFSNNGYPLTINTDINNTIQFTNGVVRNGTPGSMNAYTLIDLSNSTTQASLYYGVQGTTGGTLYTSSDTGMVMGNISSVHVSSSFVASFYSSLPAGTDVSYSITGCTAANLGISSLSGTFSSPYQAVTYTVASGGGSTIAISVSGGTIPANVYINRRIADVTGIFSDVKYSASTNRMEEFITTNTTNIVTAMATSNIVTFATGISGSNGYTVYNNLLNTATGITIFTVIKFNSFSRGSGVTEYFFTQSSDINGADRFGANLYFNTVNSPSLTMGINNQNPQILSGSALSLNTNYIITRQYGKPNLIMKCRINGTVYLDNVNTGQTCRDLFPNNNIMNYFVFGTSSNYTTIAESITCSNFLSDTDISFVENKLATTYNITLRN